MAAQCWAVLLLLLSGALCGSLAAPLQRSTAQQHHLARPDAPLEPFTREIALKHSVEVPGQPRRLLVACFADVKSATPKQRMQRALMLNWARTLRAIRLPCVVGVCEASPPLRKSFSEFITAGGCAVVHAPLAACVRNARLGRWSYAQLVTSWGLDFLSSDPDVAMLRSPLPYYAALFQKHPQVDLLSMSDASTGVYDLPSLLPLPHVKPAASLWSRHFPNTSRPEGLVHLNGRTGDDAVLPPLEAGSHELGLEDPNNCSPHQWNTGYMYIRATNRSAAILSAWIDVLAPSLDNPSADDQLPFCVLGRTNSRYCRTSGDKPPPADACGGDARLNPLDGGTACYGMLNLVQFANGFVYQVARLHEQYGVAPYVYHATYSADKARSLQEEGAWVADDDGARARREKYLTFENPLPSHFFAPPAFANWTGSWLLVQLQARRLRAALALARSLRRTLELPRAALTCQCFFYAPRRDTCVIDGLRVRLPYAAPSDHWLKPNSLGAFDTVASGGITLRGRGLMRPGSGDAPPRLRVGVVNVPAPAAGEPGWTDATARVATSHAASAIVLHIQGELERAWAGFTDADEQARFDADVADILGSWCCWDEGVHPKITTYKARYAFEGEPTLTRADNSSIRHGFCGA